MDEFFSQSFRDPPPPILRTGPSPQVIRLCRVPSRHMNSIGNMSHRHFVFRPPREEWPKDAPAHLPVQSAHAVDRAAPSYSQVGHIEGFRRVMRVLAAKAQQIVGWNTQNGPGITAEVLLHEGGSETVKTGVHRRVGRKEVAPPGETASAASKG